MKPPERRKNVSIETKPNMYHRVLHILYTAFEDNNHQQHHTR